jgi:cytochrome c5
MDIAISVTLGLLFMVASLAATCLRVFTWRSSDPKAGGLHLIRLRQIFEVVYAAIYVVMMFEMLPRLWAYQVELPPRTVFHVAIGFVLGALLLLQLLVGLARELRAWMPVLSAMVFVNTVLLCGLSVPFALHEYGLARGQAGGSVYSDESREVLARALPLAGLPEEARPDELTSVESLRRGRNVLAQKCVVCHDLKTVLVQPRKPADWWHTVARMAEKPTFSEPLTQLEQWEVTAYLIAIANDVSASDIAQHEETATRRATAIAVATKRGSNFGADRVLYEKICSECHPLADIEAHAPRSAEEVAAVIERMIVENGMIASKEEIELVYGFMVGLYVADAGTAAPMLTGPQAPASLGAAVPGPKRVKKKQP